MLTQEEIQTIKETVPLLKEKGETITSLFYKRLFEQHPEMKNIFNQTNQKKGLQSSALAMAVLSSAENIKDLSPIVPVVMPVVYKHCALQVIPEQYPIIGENLIWAIEEVTGLSEDDPIIQTWMKAYDEIADTFISLEKDVYAQMAWDGFLPFEVTDINQETSDIKSFTVTSSKIDLSQFTPGQYITVDISSDKLPYNAKRHYSIVDGNQDYLTFGVRKDVTDQHEGEVSTILHDEVKVGDMLNLTAPVGDFHADYTDNHNQLFIGSGVGVTPLVSMYKEAINKDVTSTFIQVAPDNENIAFESMLQEMTKPSSNATLHTHLRDQEGHLESDKLKNYIDINTEIYICGGTTFLNSIINSLQALDVPTENIHYETFVPKLSFAVS